MSKSAGATVVTGGSSPEAAEPGPELPAPAEPKPAEPKPEIAVPAEPEPTEPRPEIIVPEKPTPELPAPTEPKPAEPGPEITVPPEPKPEITVPAEPEPQAPRPEVFFPTEAKPELPAPTDPTPAQPKPEVPAPPSPAPVIRAVEPDHGPLSGGRTISAKAPPRVTSVTPDRGSNAGGTQLTVRGHDFDEEAAVFVCGLAAPVVFKSREELAVATPAVARDGLVDVRVVNRDDQAHAIEKAFRYLAPLPPPQLRQVSPAGGPSLGGLEVAVLGEDFAEGVTVRFGGVPAATRFLTGKELKVTTPAFSGAGEVVVEVVNPDGASSVLEAAFTYEARPAPEITGIRPTSGPTTGGTRVIIEGKSFTSDAAVYLGREPPKDIAFKSATEIAVVTAARKQAGVVDVEVVLPGALKGVMKNGFRYDAVPAPAITSVAPTAGGVGGGTELTISGKNFVKETVVLVDGKAPRAVKLVDGATIELKTPPGEAGKMVDVMVRNPDGKEAVQKRAFLYDPRYRG